jgi:hypothetical protein
MKSLALAIAVLILSAGAANAFTYEGRSSFNADGTAARLTDPDDQLSDGSHKSTKSKNGFTFQFSGANSGNNAATNGPFVPSANSAFSSPFQRQRAFGSPFNNSPYNN